MRGLTRSLASSPVDRHEVIDPTSNRNRHRIIGSIESLSESAGTMYNPALRSDAEISPSIKRHNPIKKPVYNDNNELVDPGDSSPEMELLWEKIDKLKDKLDKAPPGTRYYY